jgi:hypothetical protein
MADARYLLKPADIREAIAWRLAGVSGAEISALACVLRPLAADFREDRAEVASVLNDLRPTDCRRAWSLACAVLADDALRLGDLATFWAAGCEVVVAARNSRRAASRTGDQLSALIGEHLRHRPDVEGPALFNHFGSMAGPHHEVLTDFFGGVLSFVPRPGRDIADIEEHAFCARVSRLRNHVCALA